MKKLFAFALLALLTYRAGSGIVQMQGRPVPQVWLGNSAGRVTVLAIATESGLRLTTENQTNEIALEPVPVNTSYSVAVVHVNVYALATESGLRLTTEDNNYEIAR